MTKASGISVLLITGVFILLISCQGKGIQEQSYALVKAEKRLDFPLDRNTKSFILALFPYTDMDGKEYLTFQNQGQNEILFYDMEKEELAFKVRPAYEGDQGVGSFIGYHIHNLDSIFLTKVWESELVIVDKDAVIVDKINYKKAEDGTSLSQFYATSSMYTPMMIQDEDIYIMPGANRWIEKSPVCAVINLRDKSVNAYLTFLYPTFPGSDNKDKRASAETHVSRIYDGEQFIYSFHFDEYIYVTSLDHSTIRQVKVKSQYIDKVKILDDYGNLTPEDVCENPNYGNLFYDPYRDVYYRIAYPKAEVEKGIRGAELFGYGRKNFSILILDKEFNVIGETMFPNYTYNSNIMFIREDGLYICDSHYLNSDYSDDILGFSRFDLIKEEK